MSKLTAVAFSLMLFIGIACKAQSATVNVTENFGTGATSGCYGISCLPGWEFIFYNQSTDAGYSDLNTGNSGDRYMFIDNYAVVATKVDTTGFDSIQLSFDIRSYLFDANERMHIGWAVSPSTPTSWSDFTLLETLLPNDNWENKSYSLNTAAGNTQNLWIGFYVDAADLHQLDVDNVLISGQGIVQTTSFPWPMFLPALSGANTSNK